MRRRAHQATVEVAGADQVIQHLGPHLTGVEDGGPLRHHALAVGRGHLGGAETHVAAKAQRQLRGWLVGQLGRYPGEGAPDGQGCPGVELLAVEAAYVVGLEDLRVDVVSHVGRDHAS